MVRITINKANLFIMVVYNLDSQIVEIDGYIFINVTEQATDLFYAGLDLYEITEENGTKIEHLISDFETLLKLEKQNISIYKEEIK